MPVLSKISPNENFNILTEKFSAIFCQLANQKKGTNLMFSSFFGADYWYQPGLHSSISHDARGRSPQSFSSFFFGGVVLSNLSDEELACAAAAGLPSGRCRELNGGFRSWWTHRPVSSDRTTVGRDDTGLGTGPGASRHGVPRPRPHPIA
jgi:hypothetical protein